jgi:arginase
VVPAPPYSPDLDPRTRVRNGTAIPTYSAALARALDPLIRAGRFPVVLGGDCSILLGSALALRRHGRHGLLYVDGHTDFATPATSPSGGAAGMDLALVCGHGPAELADLEGLRPLIRESDIVVLGHRDIRDPGTYPARAIFASAIRLCPLDTIQQVGVRRSGSEAVQALCGVGVAGFWVHVDVDVLDSDVMPAVDSPQPGGLTYAELTELLRVALASELAVGLQVTIFDPDLDSDGRLARELTDVIAEALSGRDR